jgi:hypothetical protein
MRKSTHASTTHPTRHHITTFGKMGSVISDRARGKIENEMRKNGVRRHILTIGTGEFGVRQQFLTVENNCHGQFKMEA